jgi:putative acetyltransferase
MTDIAIELVPRATDEVRQLLTELDDVLGAEYPPEQRHALKIEVLFEPHIRFFLARLDGAAVGCGGVALYPDFAELKRMYVRDGLRGRGVADAILWRIEAATREAGQGVLRLETGDRQLAAMRFYERSGFQKCPVFGPYAEMTPHAIATSVFFEKRL